MSRPLFLLACVAAGLAGTASAPPHASACSCLPPEPQRLMAEADGAFVGRFLGRGRSNGGPIRSSADPVVYRFAVERALKGTLPPTIEVVSAADSASCGLDVAAGRRIGLTLEQDGRAWRSGLCQQADPVALAAAATPGEGSIVREDVATGLGRLTAAAAAVLVLVSAGVFLIRRRYRSE